MLDCTTLSISAMVSNIQKGDTYAEGCLYRRLLHACYPTVRGFIRNKGMQEADAEDFFQDGFIALIKSIKLQRFKFRTLPVISKIDQLSSFIMQTVKNLWKKRLRQNSRPEVNWNTEQELQNEFELLEGLSEETLNQLSISCRELLIAHFREKVSLHELGKQRTPRLKGSELQKELSPCVKNYLEILNSEAQGETKSELYKIAFSVIKEMDSNCSKILLFFYSDSEKMKMTEIAKALNYKNAHAVRTAKYNCMKDLNLKIAEKMIQSKPS